MTALDELRAGRLGETFVQLLYRQVLVVGRRFHFPPPEGHATWSAEAAVDEAHEYLADSNSYTRLIELAAKVDDDASLQRTLMVMLRNHLRVRGRRTVTGKLMRRLAALMSVDPRFVVTADTSFALSGSSPERYSGSTERLHAAARAVRDVKIVHWSPQARRDGPVADAPTLLALCVAVLRAAAGALPLLELTEVVAARVGLDLRGISGTLSVDDIDIVADRGPLAAPASSPEAAVSVLGRSIEDQQIVGAVLEEFSAREKLVLAWLHLSVRDVARETGLAVSTAGAISQRVRDKLIYRLAGIDASSAERIALAVRDSARAELRLEPL